MTALTDQLAAPRREAQAALDLAKSIHDEPQSGTPGSRSDVVCLAASVQVLAAAVLALADYTETPL